MFPILASVCSCSSFSFSASLSPMSRHSPSIRTAFKWVVGIVRRIITGPLHLLHLVLHHVLLHFLLKHLGLEGIHHAIRFVIVILVIKVKHILVLAVLHVAVHVKVHVIMLVVHVLLKHLLHGHLLQPGLALIVLGVRKSLVIVILKVVGHVLG